MAVFRGGKRLGPFDIRLGFPRDKSLNNVDRDPRIRQTANPENTIGRFRAAMGKAEGYARAARFAVKLFLPANLEKLAGIKPSIGIEFGNGQKVEPKGGSAGNPDAATLVQLSKQMGQQMDIHCDTVSMPGHDLTTETVDHYGPTRDFVTGHGFTGTIAASFYADKFLRERHFLEFWQKMAVNMTNHKAGYYRDYIGRMHIYQLGSVATAGDRDVPTYGIEATEVYPATISAVEYAYGSSSQIVKINVGFQYKEWYNLATDKIGGIKSGHHLQRVPDEAGGPEGIFGKLPPELQRVGRDVFNQGKTVLNPVGKIFKGKVFPPYT